MAVELKDLIDINLLDYYDEKVKEWVINILGEKTSGLELTTNAELPAEGEEGKIYVTENEIVTWNSIEQKYITVGGASGRAQWE